MGFDANGSYTRLRGSDAWKGDAQVGTKIMAPLHDDNDNDLANALSDCLNRRGYGNALANISMGGFKLTNLGTPTEASDAATKAYADATKASTTGLVISGADANGLLSFTSPTGTNGLSFTGADMSWLARIGVVGVSYSRMVLNDKPDGSGTDVASISEIGSMYLASNLLTGGEIVAGGRIVGYSVVGVKGSGNAHFWFYGPNNEDREVIYTNVGIVDSINLRTANGYAFTFSTAGNFHSPGAVYADTAMLQINGDINGSVWGSWGNNSAFLAISAQIEARAQAWADNRVSLLQYRRVSQTYDTAAHVVAPAGAVLSGYSRQAGTTGQVFGVYYVYLQSYDPVRGWVGWAA